LQEEFFKKDSPLYLRKPFTKGFHPIDIKGISYKNIGVNKELVFANFSKLPLPLSLKRLPSFVYLIF